ncbi:DUF1858 domain-containing protein [Niveispirillum sp. KHB5.9]|uniref:DUF1858 domain-containing protein n=1 Tax=Niveispirillum sp. KHB5.9 TaxID=3400269 RepID=UPI003A853341
MAAALTVPIRAETILDDLMATYKVTIPIFIRCKMMCVGCPIASLHDVQQACTEHGIPLSAFLAEINGAIMADR